MEDQAGNLGGAILAAFGIWAVIGLAFYIWYLWSLSVLFPRIGLPAAHGWIPIFNQWRLVERGGLPGWLVLLGIVPFLGIVVLVVTLIAMYRINTEFGKGAGFTVLGLFIPPLWAMLLAKHIDDTGRGVTVTSAPGAGVQGSSAQGSYAGYQPQGQGPTAPAQQQYAQQTYGQQAYGQQSNVQRPYAQQPGGAPSQGGAQAQPPLYTPPGYQPGAPAPVPNVAPAPNAAPVDAPATAGGEPAAPLTGIEALFAESNAAEELPPVPAHPPVAPPAQTAPSAPVAPVAGEFAPGAARPQRITPVPPPPAAPQSPQSPEAQSPQVDPYGQAPARPSQPSQPNQQSPWGFSNTTEDAYERLAAQDPGLRADGQLGPVEPQRPFSWPGPEEPVEQLRRSQRHPEFEADQEAQADPVPLEIPDATTTPRPQAGAPAAPVDPTVSEAPAAPAVSETPAVPVGPAAAPVAPPVVAPAAPPAAPAADEDDERTVVVPRRKRWGLVLPGGEVEELIGDDVVVGRRPEAADGVEVLKLVDPTRTISKSHARFRRTGDGWTIEDLHSTNGVAIVDPARGLRVIEPGVEVPATERLTIGTLEVSLREL